MIAGFTTIRSIVSVGVVLVVAFILTGTISSAYRRERASLGQQHYHHGHYLEQHGKPEAGVDEYREALLYLPENQQYRLSLATALVSAGHLDEAQAHLEQLAQEDPTNGRINLELAHVAMRRGQVNGAIESYQRAVYEYWPPQEIPQRRKARWELVKLLEASGHRDQTISELLQLYASAPPDPDERAKIGFLLVQAGANSEASQIFRNLERSFPQKGYGHRGLGEVDFAAGDYVAARHEFQHALRVDPKDRESQEALALTNSVIELDPVLPDIGSAERLRRSQKLLTRIVIELTQCWTVSAPTAVAQQQLDEARGLLVDTRPPNEDFNLTLQREAQLLWQNRSSFCPASVPVNRAITLAVGRISNE